MTKIIGENNSTGLFQYFIKLIPTVYKDDSGNVIRTNQYTVSDRFRPFVMPKFDGSEKVRRNPLTTTTLNLLSQLTVYGGCVARDLLCL